MINAIGQWFSNFFLPLPSYDTLHIIIAPSPPPPPFPAMQNDTKFKQICCYELTDVQLTTQDQVKSTKKVIKSAGPNTSSKIFV